MDRFPRKALRKEIPRKWVHLSSIVIPVLFAFFPKKYLLPPLVAGTVLLIVLDLLKTNNRGFRRVIFRYFGDLFRSKERRQITGASTLAISMSLAFLLFDVNIAIIAVSYIIIGDVFAAIVGTMIGRHKIIGKHTLEGSLAFFISAAVATSAMAFVDYGEIPILLRVSGALIGALVELFLQSIDDNIAVPMAGGIFLHIALKLI
jgi:dolichol kinase